MIHFEACGKPSGIIAIQSLGILEQWLPQQRINSTVFENQLPNGTLDRGTPNDHTAQIPPYDLGLPEPPIAKLDRPHSWKAVPLKNSRDHMQAHSCEKRDSFNRELWLECCPVAWLEPCSGLYCSLLRAESLPTRGSFFPLPPSIHLHRHFLQRIS